MTTKQVNKQLKRPDSFQIAAYRGMQWFQDNLLLVGKIIAPFIIAGLLFLGWQLFSYYTAQQRRTELGKIDISYDEEAQKKAESREILEKSAEELKASLEKPENAAAPNHEKLKADLALKEAEVEKIKVEPAAFVEKYKKFYETNKSHVEGWRAALSAMQLLIEDKKIKEASDLAGDMLPRVQKEYFYKTSVRMLYIGLLEEQGRFDDALKEAEAVFAYASEDLKPKILLMEGRLYLDKKDVANANKMFEKVINDFNASPEAQKARGFQSIAAGS